MMILKTRMMMMIRTMMTNSIVSLMRLSFKKRALKSLVGFKDKEWLKINRFKIIKYTKKMLQN